MAAETGMAGFVKGRNGDANPDLTDLKRAVPSPGIKEEKRHKPKQGTSARREKSSGRQSRPQQNAALKSNNSSAENLSTTASTTRQRSGRDQARPIPYDQHATGGDNYIYGSTNFHEEPDNDQDLPQDPTPMDDKRFSMILAQSRAQPDIPTIAQTHIKGDSYPPTTSGVPSVTDLHDRTEVMPSGGGLHNLPTHAAERRMYDTRAHRQQQPNATRQLPATSHIQGRPLATANQLQDPMPLDSEPASDFAAIAGFPFARGHNIKKEIAVHTNHPQRPAANLQPFTPEVKADAPRLHREANKQATAHARHVANGQPVATERHAYRPEQQQHVAQVQDYDYQQQHAASGEQAKMPNQGPASDAFSEEDPVDRPEQQEFTEDSLDYGLDELYQKDYSSLKAEPFDSHPNAHPFVVSGLPDSAALTDKLVHLTGAEPKTQADFFASLNIDDWEEAGDWFLDQFGDTVKKLKDVRREKRKAARAFEDEIELREKVVRKKFALTDSAMVDMRASGAAVLQGTPRKKK
jgi:hypothetical protein